MRALLNRAYAEVQAPRRFMIACAIGVALSGLYPSDVASYRAGAIPGDGSIARITDSYLRFINTAVQFGLPLVLEDPIGFVQAVYVTAATTVATHGLKRLTDRWQIGGTRLGERPLGGQPNVPSGHSSMASCAAYFVSRRYGWRHLFYLLPILFLTMYARVALEAHTISAVIAGALLGLLVAALFTSRRKPVAGPLATDALQSVSGGPSGSDAAARLIP